MDNEPRGKSTLAGMTQDEPEDLNDPAAETGPFVELTSQDAPGYAENGVMEPPPRTVRYSHPSGKAPDYRTPHISDVHHLHDERFSIPAAVGTTTGLEFEWCRQALKRTIQNCRKLDFSYVASAVSCILNSLRPLHTREIDTAVGLFVEYADTDHPSYGEDEAAGKMWLHRCVSFLRVDDAGLVHFTSAFMPMFLRRFRIRGIDATHQTIATACLIQVDLDDNADSRALTRSMPCISTNTSLAFSGYAERYWREHCQSAEQSCQDVSATTCVGPSAGESAVPRDLVGRMAANADADLDTIGVEGLKLEDDDNEEEWVML